MRRLPGQVQLLEREPPGLVLQELGSVRQMEPVPRVQGLQEPALRREQVPPAQFR